MEICVLWPDHFGRLNYQLWKNIILITIGLIGLVVGTYKSIFDIIVSFQPISTPLEDAVNATLTNALNNVTAALIQANN